MDLRDWEIIYKLYLHKNITKTAKELYLSQPRLTTKIRMIEQELGVTIIKRNNRGVEFTSVGNYVAQYAMERLQDFKLFKDDIQTMSYGMVGNIRIVAPYVVVKYILPEILLAFQKLYPLVTFDITTMHSGVIVNYLKTHFCDFGFIRNSLEMQQKDMLRIETGGISIVYKQKFALADLPNMLRIDYKTDNYYHNFLNEWWNSNFKHPGRIGVNVGYLESCREMIFSGLGYGILPNLVIPKKSKLFIHPLVNTEAKPYLRSTWMIYQNEVIRRTLPKTFYEFLVNYIKN